MKIPDSVTNNPVRLAGIAAALVGLAIRLGMPIPPEYSELATTILIGVLPVLANEIARRFSWGPVTVARIQAVAERAVSK